MVQPRMNRRQFLSRASAAAITSVGAFRATAAPPRNPELRITRIVMQPAKGRRLTPVAPNAYAPYRGYDVSEPVLRIQTPQGIEGIAHHTAKPEDLRRLLGLDPFALFDWDGDTVRGPAEPHRQLLADLYGADVALLDLLGKALKRPIAVLLGKRLRDEVKVYDSSLYMEDLLKPAEAEGLAYLKDGPAPGDPAQRVARKAQWVLAQPEGVRILKIKIGRAKWMASFDDAAARDVAVVKAIRRAVGKDVTLFVDGNNGYKPLPAAAGDFALAVGDEPVYAMEEMFPEEMVAEAKEVKKRIRAGGLGTKLADGETYRDGIPEKLRAERVDVVTESGGLKPEPLFDIEQADMNANGYLRMSAIARTCAKHGMTVAPHNFGSKLGFYTQVHLGLVTPNWEFCETDDSQFPALVAEGFKVEKGLARLTGKPGLGVTLKEEALEKPTFELGAGV